MDKQPELAVDIGGGAGERYVKLAKSNPGKTYLVLDPRIEAIPNKPENLHLLKWKSDKDSALPLSANSVDEVSIGFLMGEIVTKEWDDGSIETAKERYRNLLRDASRVLRTNGLVEIADVRDNIYYIAGLLEEQGFTIESGPEKLKEENYTTWAASFRQLFKRVGMKEEDSHILPMYIRAHKKQN